MTENEERPMGDLWRERRELEDQQARLDARKAELGAELLRRSGVLTAEPDAVIGFALNNAAEGETVEIALL